MIVAITGGSGFIGSHLAQRHLQQGDEVRLLSRQKNQNIVGAKYFFADLSDPKSDYRHFVKNADVLYHCAGEVINESLMKSLHVEGTQRLMDEALGNVGRWIQLSSVGAYGLCRTGVISEKSPESPVGIYEKTKTEADLIVKTSGIPFVILRPSNVFGLKMSNQSLFQLIERIKKGHFFYLGKKGARVNYVHVDDVVSALMEGAINNSALGNIYNLSQTIYLEQMVKAILSHQDDQIIMRLPEWPIKKLALIFRGVAKFPLSVSRINALTNRCSYQSDKIKDQIGFEFDFTLAQRFQAFSQNNEKREYFERK